MVHRKKLLRRSSVKYRTFEGPVWSYYLEKMKSAKNCLKIVANMVKIGKFLVRIIFIPWDAFIICKINKKPGQMYQKCHITCSVAVLFGRSRILPVISGLNCRLLWSSFGWFTKRNFSEGPALSIGPFQKVQREVIYPLCSEKNWNWRILDLVLVWKLTWWWWEGVCGHSGPVSGYALVHKCVLSTLLTSKF